MENEIIKKAIEKTGSQEALAAQLKISQAMVSKMLRGLSPVSPGAVIPLEKILQGAYSRQQIRPDLYPAE